MWLISVRSAKVCESFKHFRNGLHKFVNLVCSVSWADTLPLCQKMFFWPSWRSSSVSLMMTYFHRPSVCRIQCVWYSHFSGQCPPSLEFVALTPLCHRSLMHHSSLPGASYAFSTKTQPIWVENKFWTSDFLGGPQTSAPSSYFTIQCKRLDETLFLCLQSVCQIRPSCDVAISRCKHPPPITQISPSQMLVLRKWTMRCTTGYPSSSSCFHFLYQQNMTDRCKTSFDAISVLFNEGGHGYRETRPAVASTVSLRK